MTKINLFLGIFLKLTGAIFGILLIPLISRNISPSVYGKYSLYVTQITIIMTFCFLPSIESIVYRFLNKKSDKFIKNLEMVIKLNFIAVAFYIFISLFYFMRIKDTLFIVLNLYFLLTFFFNQVTFFTQINHNTKQLNLLIGIELIFKNIFIIYSFFIKKIDVNTIFLGSLYFKLILFSFIIFKLKKNIFKVILNLKKINIRRGINYGLPLILVNIAGLILMSSDRLFISKLKNGNYYNGVYSINYSLYFQSFMLIITILNFYVPGYLFSLYDNKKYYEFFDLLKKIFHIFINCSYFIFLFIWSSRDNIAKIFLSKQYEINNQLALIFIYSSFFYGMYLILINYFMTKKKNKITAFLITFVAVFNIILNYIFINKYGYIAAAYTTLIGYFILFITAYVVFYKTEEIKLLEVREIILFIIISIIVFRTNFNFFNIYDTSIFYNFLYIIRNFLIFITLFLIKNFSFIKSLTLKKQLLKTKDKK